MFYEDLAFSAKLESAAKKLYQEVWPFSTYERLIGTDGAPHVFDKSFGIDSTITLDTREIIPIQEKFRRYDKLHYKDLVLEYKNGDGSLGEYFHLFSHYLVLAYASADETSFVHYKIYDIPKLRRIIHELGGLKGSGTPIRNAAHGKSFAFAVSWDDVQDAVIWQGSPFSMTADIQA
jgi:hypothetical protein